MLLFTTVVREGSFTRAARQLGITKQSASERVARLEERLGVRLLERSTRSLRVTEIGSRYDERCSTIAAQIEEANREAQLQQAEPTGVLRISAPVLYGRRFLSPVISGYMARHPKVERSGAIGVTARTRAPVQLGECHLTGWRIGSGGREAAAGARSRSTFSPSPLS